MRSEYSRDSAGVMSRIAEMSAPATKAFSPAPVSTMPRTDQSGAASALSDALSSLETPSPSRSAPNTRRNSSMTAGESAFNTAGRLTVTVRIASSISSSSVSSSRATSACATVIGLLA